MSPATSHDGQKRLKGIGLRAGSACAFGVMAAMLKLASDHDVLASEMLFYRALFGFPVVLGWLALGPGFASVRTTRPLAHFGRSVLGISSILCTFKAMTMLSLADATTIGFSAPIFATILSALILREKVGRHRWGAVVVGFLGIAIVMRPGASGGEISHAGLAIALLSALGTAGVTITLRQLSRTEHPAGIVFWFFTYSLAAGAVLVVANGSVHAPSVLAMLAAGGVMGGTAQLMMTASLKHAPVAVVAPFDYLQFLWAVLFGWLIWDHGVSSATWTGAAVIIGSGLYTVWREQRLRIRPSDSATATGALSE